MILADFVVGGRIRKVLVHFDRNRFAYTLDRATGGAHRRPVHQHQLGEVDRSSGVPILDTKQTGVSRGDVKGICPSLEAASPTSAAYSPRTGCSTRHEQPLHEL
jgi:hypothetical protein